MLPYAFYASSWRFLLFEGLRLIFAASPSIFITAAIVLNAYNFETLSKNRFLILALSLSHGVLLAVAIEFSARRVWSGKEWLLRKRARPSASTTTTITEVPTCSESNNIKPPSTLHLKPSNKLLSNPYDYEPLHRDDVRLLQILPAQSEEEPLQANMLHSTLQSAASKSFTALSYTWGSQHATDIIIVDQKELMIRPNLSAILRRMRSIGHLLVWVDAICINQADVDERSKQVLRMRTIYADAETVLVAIDTAESDLENVIRLFALANPTLTMPNQPEELTNSLRKADILASLESFCNSAYWSRIWIIQEFAIGANVEFLLGNVTFDWTKLMIIFDSLGDMGKRDLVDGFQATRVIEVRQSLKADNPLLLLDMLVRLKASKSGVKHDRVYGLLGITSDTARYAIEPNYAYKIEDISLAMSRKYITKRSLDIILLSSHRTSNQGLPSWSPDFFHFDSSPPDERTIRVASCDRWQPWGHRYRPLHKYRPLTTSHKTGDATAGAKAQVIFSGSGLRSPARRIGSITSLGKAWSDPPGSDYPKHNASTIQGNGAVNIVSSLALAIRQIRDPGDSPAMFAYSMLRIFRHKGIVNCDAESPESNMLRWLSGNRKFFVAGHYLEEHAAKLWHPMFHGFVLLWYWDLLMESRVESLFSALEYAASEDMRLMCLDDNSFGIGWAVKRARLCDEVFLLPGCSRPVILRLTQHGKYELIGDAIVSGIMRGELWEKTKDEHLVQVEIV